MQLLEKRYTKNIENISRLSESKKKETNVTQNKSLVILLPLNFSSQKLYLSFYKYAKLFVKEIHVLLIHVLLIPYATL